MLGRPSLLGQPVSLLQSLGVAQSDRIYIFDYVASVWLVTSWSSWRFQIIWFKIPGSNISNISSLALWHTGSIPLSSSYVLRIYLKEVGFSYPGIARSPVLLLFQQRLVVVWYICFVESRCVSLFGLIFVWTTCLDDPGSKKSRSVFYTSY